MKLVNLFLQRYEQLNNARYIRKQRTFSALICPILESIFMTLWHLILLDHISLKHKLGKFMLPDLPMTKGYNWLIDYLSALLFCLGQHVLSKFVLQANSVDIIFKTQPCHAEGEQLHDLSSYNRSLNIPFERGWGSLVPRLWSEVGSCK